VTRLRRTSSGVARGIGSGSAARLVVTLFALLAFTLQGYVTQTHIHLAPPSQKSTSSDTQKNGPDRYPLKSDPANCPICQEIAHAGQFVTPAAAALLPPSLAVSIVEIAAPIAVLARTASHTWRSRAPPQA